MQHNIILPDLGQTTSEAKIVQWLKKPGDYVSRGEAIVAVETDKVDMEVEAFESGYLRVLLVMEGSMASALAPVTTRSALSRGMAVLDARGAAAAVASLMSSRQTSP